MNAKTDVLRKLLRIEWRGVGLFATGYSFAFDQQHIAHTYPDRDAGFIEATGRNPATYSFSLLFRNGNALAPEEQYPLTWRKFIVACLDRSTGTLLHPELGPIKVKCRSQQTQWDGTKRDGVDVSAEFVETSDTEDELAALLKRSAAYDAEYEAQFLDDNVKDVKPAPDVPSTLAPSLLDSMKQLTGTIAMAKASVGNVAASIEAYANAVDDLAEQINDLNNPAYAPILESLRRLHGAVIDLGLPDKAAARPVTSVTVKRDAPVAAVASAFANKLEDFLALNPSAASRTSLAAGTPVFVYAA